jgi:hypothetical protein
MTDTVVIQLTPVGAGIRPAFHHSNMAKFQRSCPKVERLFGNRGPRTEGQGARAGDQWTVLEMWLSACVGGGFGETSYSPICLAIVLFDLISLHDV